MASNALMAAIRTGDTAGVKSIVATDPTAISSREDAASPVLTALYNGQLEIADFLASRCELDIFEAAASGQTARLSELVLADPKATTQLSPDGWTPLHLAAFFGRTDAARHLMESGADVRAISLNGISNTPLHAALAGRGDEELVLRLLVAGADSTAASGEGFTPLHIAASRGNQRVCDLLIQYRSEPSARTKDNRTAADIATERGHPSLGDYLRSLIN